jgi:hypothetical protein
MVFSLLFAGNVLLIGYRHANEASTVSEQSVRLSYMAMCGLSIASNIVFFLMPKATSINKQKSVTPLREIGKALLHNNIGAFLYIIKQLIFWYFVKMSQRNE